MSQPWTFSGEPPGAAGAAEPVILVEGSTFCISGMAGDIQPGRAHGLFVRDTRVLSRWELAIDGITPQPLAVHVHPDG